MPSLGDRTTGELVILVLSIGVVLTLVMSTAGVLVGALLYGDANRLGEAASSVVSVMAVLAGAVVGYLAGDRKPRP